MLKKVSSSAGTVYLEGLGDAQRGGKLRIFNDGTDGNLVVTPFPATGAGADAARDFKRVNLEIGSAARVYLSQNVAVRSLVVEGTKVASGSYTAAALNELLATQAFSGSGILKVGLSGFSVIIR